MSFFRLDSESTRAGILRNSDYKQHFLDAAAWLMSVLNKITGVAVAWSDSLDLEVVSRIQIQLQLGIQRGSPTTWIQIQSAGLAHCVLNRLFFFTTDIHQTTQLENVVCYQNGNKG